MLNSRIIINPWQHWLVDDFLSLNCLAEVKQINGVHEQKVYGKRSGSVRMFITDKHQNTHPNLYNLYQSLHWGEYRDFFENQTNQSFEGLFPRVEVISDYGQFYLHPHTDRAEKKLTAIVYTDYKKMYPGTALSDDYRIPAADNRCFFFVPSQDTIHSYPLTNFTEIRRCLQINYWTYYEEH